MKEEVLCLDISSGVTMSSEKIWRWMRSAMVGLLWGMGAHVAVVTGFDPFTSIMTLALVLSATGGILVLPSTDQEVDASHEAWKAAGEWAKAYIKRRR